MNSYTISHPQYFSGPPPTYVAQHPQYSQYSQTSDNQHIHRQNSEIQQHHGPTYQGSSFIPVSTSCPKLPPVISQPCYDQSYQSSCYVCPHDAGHDPKCSKMHDDVSSCLCTII